MGIRAGFCPFSRPSCYGGKVRKGGTGTRVKEIEFEIPDFPKTRARALRFGSMNSIRELRTSWGSPERAWHGD